MIPPINTSNKPKSKTKKWLIISSLLALVILILLFWLFGIERMEQAIYDINNENKYIDRKEDLDKILNSYKKIKYDQLPASFKKRTKMDQLKYSKLVKNQSFYIIHKKDVYKKIVGNFRIKDLFSRDMDYHNTYYFDDKTILYWGIDRRILYKILELQDLLTTKKYDRNAFFIGYGHRSPQINELILAAPQSRHIAGEAVDLTIGDINKDGKYTDIDKQIVLDLCEKYIIKNQGGIGLYPNTRAVHIDVRGYRARWNSY